MGGVKLNHSSLWQNTWNAFEVHSLGFFFQLKIYLWQMLTELFSQLLGSHWHELMSMLLYLLPLVACTFTFFFPLIILSTFPRETSLFWFETSVKKQNQNVLCNWWKGKVNFCIRNFTTARNSYIRKKCQLIGCFFLPIWCWSKHRQVSVTLKSVMDT